MWQKLDGACIQVRNSSPLAGGYVVFVVRPPACSLQAESAKQRWLDGSQWSQGTGLPLRQTEKEAARSKDELPVPAGIISQAQLQEDACEAPADSQQGKAESQLSSAVTLVGVQGDRAMDEARWI